MTKKAGRTPPRDRPVPIARSRSQARRIKIQMSDRWTCENCNWSGKRDELDSCVSCAYLCCPSCQSGLTRASFWTIEKPGEAGWYRILFPRYGRTELCHILSSGSVMFLGWPDGHRMRETVLYDSRSISFLPVPEGDDCPPSTE